MGIEMAFKNILLCSLFALLLSVLLNRPADTFPSETAFDPEGCEENNRSFMPLGLNLAFQYRLHIILFVGVSLFTSFSILAISAKIVNFLLSAALKTVELLVAVIILWPLNLFVGISVLPFWLVGSALEGLRQVVASYVTSHAGKVYN